ncbi:hypothetical protein [Phenylobacterium sp.]|uniref:hypothetical protein n=1 Tax=Phenylobacterium sp. TaxID=1871053 RepID=UPI002B5FA544|nr:hypothetical protein [Phenylobacterium sp.]HLZ75388.1 hypothetical protein [Phenylobacterium sp.]
MLGRPRGALKRQAGARDATPKESIDFLATQLALSRGLGEQNVLQSAMGDLGDS